ncbi:MAG: aromatic ring-hydroxylating dioxygenase subunit alpha [Acidimicrobiales bacterium]|nr:aromatic ring-hydroxylating dioxygenase subunit alpha [Acidimicrobiales bacterium]
MASTATERIVDEWFPVIDAALVRPGTWHPFELLDDRYVLACGDDGTVLVTRDTCPHRGARLTLGTFDGGCIQCPYHGWRFDTAGRCVEFPAHPGLEPPAAASLRPLRAQEAYGLWWVCLGDDPRPLPYYPAYAEHPGRTVNIGPKILEATGPRIVENFLDMAHFPYVHGGYLGEVPRTEVRDYDVATDDSVPGGELRFTNCVFWQPDPGPTAVGGGDVGYEYGVSHPYAARLRKVPELAGDDTATFSLLIVASPETETRCRVWMLTTVADPAGDLDSFNAYNEIIFGQDVDTVESQRPKRLPLDPRAEVHQRADKGSNAYRRWLADRGIRYGTSLNDSDS